MVRRSLKTWVYHMQWTPTMGGIGEAERIGVLRGLLKVYGRGRGYLLWGGGRAYWAPSVEGCLIEEYLPPDWIDSSLKASRVCRWFPIYAIVFRGYVRRGQGERQDAREAIAEHWAGAG